MSKQLTIEELKVEYSKADNEGRKWLAKVTSETNYDLNAHATIMMNAYITIKSHIIQQIGKQVMETK